MFWPPAGAAFDTWAACFVHKKSATLIRRVAARDTMEDTVSSQFAEAQVCSKSGSPFQKWDIQLGPCGCAQVVGSWVSFAN